MLSLIMVLSLAGCTIRSPQTVVQVEGEDIPAGLYLFYQFLSYSDALNELYNTEDTIETGTIEEMPAKEWIHAETIEYLQHYVWVKKTYEEKGLTLSEEAQLEYDEKATENYEANREILEANGVGVASYQLFYLNELQNEQLYETYHEENKDGVDDTRAKAYMNENYANAEMLTLPVTDESYQEVSEENKALIMGYADEMETRLASGEEFRTVAEELLAKAFVACGREYTEESFESYYGNTFITKDATDAYPQEMIDNLFGANPGDVFRYSEYPSPTIYQRHANYADETAVTEEQTGSDIVEPELSSDVGVLAENSFELYRDSIVSEITTKDYNDKVNEESAAFSVTEDAAAVKTYSIDKIKDLS